jgi:uncharacterized OB-fold protein
VQQFISFRKSSIGVTDLENNPSTHERFIQTAKKCRNCGKIMLETMYYCSQCSKSDFEFVQFPGIGTVVTHTIQSVAPEGFDDINSYAWVVFKLKDAPISASGFLPGIKTPAELPIGSTVKVKGYDAKHGLTLEKQVD